ncbi:DUF4333 domain-containing protein [Mycolicibacterium austroafricanum]|uniref:DUF4333 domain-containing protein n=3 Tax=Mycobacteriaceae TaxID=1762 RepID=A1TAK0_MYCVP|nr:MULTISPECIES: DUF4333 domain-containing protein [Mycolicibacterium]ABM14200.1 hypothetical protein Mvan_3404 [Mycolicibacterium vanbaalenii PYR-1]MCV7128591.1 DUF4333 domain-containing protein [Mycolicibacterium vanbaalenii PYR-1]MDN4520243.1 DUF4333 domain-containing protein [Mycolicibacterium austroafricanum]MDW5614707.1 DUF4333 domain-containing protein [Mycolicibacterium sp. D5.8-2]PQP42179.1 DUF4333 domain-containing protein [Mycolicibacterium austroafricanum]
MRKAFGRLAGPLVGVVAAVAPMVGCGTDAADGVPAVSTADLQRDIAERFAEAGARPQSVTCKDPLVGEVGQTARCDVTMSPTNSFEPIVTVTGVDGETVDYELLPALSVEQLERAVARLVAEDGGPPDSTVTCQAGLLGRPGEVARCDVTAGGVTLRRTAEVTGVDGLMMNFDLVPMLTKAEVERSLLDELARHLGRRPDSATCSGDLEGRPGNSVDCAVTDGPESAAFILTVTAVDGDRIDYSYAPRG